MPLYLLNLYECQLGLKSILLILYFAFDVIYVKKTLHFTLCVKKNDTLKTEFPLFHNQEFACKSIIKGTLAQSFPTYFFGQITKIGPFKDFYNIFHQKNMNAYN